MTTTEWRRWLGAAALMVLLAILLVDTGKLLATAALAIRYPYDLDYGEGIVWQQMSNIVAGTGYAPLGTFPAIVYHYPPAYHLVVAATIWASGLDPLVAGRLVSLCSTLASMAMIGWLSREAARAGDRRAGLIGAVVAGLSFAAGPTVLAWAPLMRVDMLATVLTLAGLCCTVREMRTPSRFPAAAILFALAVYTKQTAVLGPLAAFGTLWMVERRAAWRFLAICGAIGVATLVAMMVATHGEFLRHVVSYNVNRLDVGRWHMLATTLASQSIMLSVAAVVVVTLGRRLVEVPVRLVLAIYLVLRIASLPLALKSGASDNYLIDLFSVAAVFLGVGAAGVAAAVLGKAAWPRPLVTLLVLVALPVQAARLGEAHPVLRDAPARAEADAMVATIRAAQGPVVTDYMVLLRRAGQPVLFEPAIAAELAHSGLYDEAGLVRMLAAHAFAFVLTQGDGRIYVERYNPAVRAAIERAYPRIERRGDMVLHLPASVPVSRAGQAAPPRQ